MKLDIEMIQSSSVLELFHHVIQDRAKYRHNARIINGKDLSIGTLIAIQKDKAQIYVEEDIYQDLQKSVETLDNLLKKGVEIYGVTSGFGGSANTKIYDPQDSVGALIRLLNVGFNTGLPADIVRGIVCLRINNILRNHSAVRREIVENLVVLLNKNITPWIPERGSISASGDLIPSLSIATLLAGDNTAKAYIPTQMTPVNAQQALQFAKIKPISFRPKEVLAIVNGTAASTSIAVSNIGNALQLVHMAQALSAMAVEVMKGSIHSFDPFIQEVRPCPGQGEVADNIHRMLRNSKFIREDSRTFKFKGDLLQDRYSLRTTPQWLGPSLNLFKNAYQAIQIELNSTTDNPLFCFKQEKSFEGGNFQASSMAMAMETVRIALQQIGKLMFSQFQEMVDYQKNKGLPPNLAYGEPSKDYGLKGVDISMAAYMSELSWLSNTVTNHVQSAELHNQNVNSLAMISGRATANAIDVLQMMVACHLYGLVQACDLREMQNQFLIRLRQYFANRASKDSQLFKGIKEKGIGLFEETSIAFLQNTSSDLKERFCKVFSIVAGNIMSKLGENTETIQFQEMSDWIKQRAQEVSYLYQSVQSTYKEEAYDSLGLSRSLYKYVRQELNICLNTGQNNSTPIWVGIQQIYDSIKTWNINESLMECFLKQDNYEIVAKL